MRRLTVLPVLIAAAAALAVVPAGAAQAPQRTRAMATVAIAGDSLLGVRKVACASTRCDKRTDIAVTADEPSYSLTEGESTAQASPRRGRAVAVARGVRIFDGLVVAATVRREIVADADGTRYAGQVTGLQIGDEQVGDLRDAETYDLPDGLGTVLVNTREAGLRVSLARDHGGFPAGSEVLIATVRASAAPLPVADPTPQPGGDDGAGEESGEQSSDEDGRATKPRTERKATKQRTAARRARRALVDRVRATLATEDLVFPVFGPETTTADDFGGPRQIGPHQGNDVFGPFGAPVVAVSDGRLRRVGTLPISGNRLWLVRDDGISFFYAHLSAFAPTAVDGRRVRKGEILGFTGNTGDAEPTPPHVHFEIHPNGIDSGALDPHEFLRSWRQDIAGASDDGSQRPGALVQVEDPIADE